MIRVCSVERLLCTPGFSPTTPSSSDQVFVDVDTNDFLSTTLSYESVDQIILSNLNFYFTYFAGDDSFIASNIQDNLVPKKRVW